MPAAAPPLDRDAVASALSAMAFRPVDPDRPLNLDHGFHGDEAESLLERIRALYGADVDRFWSEVDFDRYFEPETTGASFPVWVLWSLAWRVAGRLSRIAAREVARTPFTVDMFVQIVEACRAEGGRGLSVNAGASGSRFSLPAPSR